MNEENISRSDIERLFERIQALEERMNNSESFLKKCKELEMHVAAAFSVCKASHQQKKFVMINMLKKICNEQENPVDYLEQILQQLAEN